MLSEARSDEGGECRECSDSSADGVMVESGR